MEPLNIQLEIIMLKKSFFRAIVAEYTILVLSAKVKNWHTLTWDEFLQECYAWNVNPYNSEYDWETFFKQKKRLYKLFKSCL